MSVMGVNRNTAAVRANTIYNLTLNFRLARTTAAVPYHWPNAVPGIVLFSRH